MAAKKAGSKFPLVRGLSRPAAEALDDITIGTRVEFFYTTNTGLPRSAVGRVCDISGSTCCVQFVTFGCQRVPKRKLVRTTKPAPNCSAGCTC